MHINFIINECKFLFSIKIKVIIGSKLVTKKKINNNISINYFVSIHDMI